MAATNELLVGQNGAMVTQVVLRALDEPGPVFFAIDNPLNLPPIRLQREYPRPVRLPRFGSQDLASVAAFAETHGFQLEIFEIVDESMSILGDIEQEAVSGKLLEALRSGGSDAVMHRLQADFPTLGIIGIELIDEDQNSLVLRRNGILVTDDSPQATSFLSQAWRALHFA